MFQGSSSLEGGITVSLELLTNVTVSSDKSVASVQAGNKWGPTYARVAEQDLTVMGGRLYSIGVGGLTTGGGISYFANLRGWACDNVASYDVSVLQEWDGLYSCSAGYYCQGHKGECFAYTER